MRIFSYLQHTYDRAFNYCDGRWCDNRLTPHKRKITVSAVGLCALILVFYLSVYRPPADFPTQHIVSIEKGMSIAEAARHLRDERVVRSPLWFEWTTRLFGGTAGIRAGDYYFKRPAGLLSLVHTVVTGDYGLEPIRVTLHEGLTRVQMAETLSRHLPAFNAERFLDITEGKEGYLFPDSYDFLPNETAEVVARALENTFFNKVGSIKDDVGAFGRPLDDVVIMASLLEREARTLETRRIIAGILWKRLDLGMPLQVDAVFVYILGKGSHDLSLEDLKVDSPYNTYTNPGLPPGAIANPGLDALLAAVTPVESDYYYFLSDEDGVMHYARTFDEHKRNKARYLQ